MMLSKRLLALLAEIESMDSVADIGCDHGKLLIGAIEKGVKNVQAIENKKGPLAAAQKNLFAYQEKAIIRYSLSDGLQDLKPCSKIVIAGMGGDMIVKILMEGRNKLTEGRILLLEANSQVDCLRSYLLQNNFLIYKEKIVFEKGKYYQIIISNYTTKQTKEWTEEDIMFGPLLRREKPDIWQKMWQERLKMYQKILQSPDLNHDVRHQINNRTRLIQTALGVENEIK